jgi:hypothetical protein
MLGVKFDTRFGATVEISEQDFLDCLKAGNEYFDAVIPPVTQTPVRGKALKLKLKQLKQYQKRWNYHFAEDNERRERSAAAVLLWGRGMITCPSCNDGNVATALSTQVALLDGIERWRFFCGNQHLLWEMPEAALGEISVNFSEFSLNVSGWREAKTQSPWLPFFEQGDGDYTTERDAIAIAEGDTVESIAAEIQAKKDALIPR